MKAIHKYNSKTREGARRIAQSMGYKFSIYDMPDMIDLLYRAGIEIKGINYDNLEQVISDSEILDFTQVPDTAKIQF